MNIITRETKSESSAPMIQTRPPVPTAALPPSPPWTELPDDLTVNILKRLDAEEIVECAQNVCSSWRRICKNPSMWLVIDLDFQRHLLRKRGYFSYEVQNFKNICRCALDRSQGQLSYLHIDCLSKNKNTLKSSPPNPKSHTMKPRNPKKSGSSSSSSATPPPPSPPWIELPDDLTADILQRLYTEEIIESAQYVCTTWWRVCQNPAMWRSIDLDYRRPAARGNICSCGGCVNNEICRYGVGNCTHDNICRCWGKKFEYLVRRAVDLSQGQLLHLKLGVRNLYDLQNYIADRSCQLRSLTVFLRVTPDTVIEDLILVIKKLPQLEELHIMMKQMLISDDFETIGIACPMLKSFSYHNCFDEDADFTGDVMAIRKTMPNLHHLRLCEHPMGYKGLEAILDDCPRLKSLDLRLCSGLKQVYDSDHTRSERGDLWLHTDSIGFMDWITKRKDNYDTDPECVDGYHYCADIDGNYYY